MIINLNCKKNILPEASWHFLEKSNVSPGNWWGISNETRCYAFFTVRLLLLSREQNETVKGRFTKPVFALSTNTGKICETRRVWGAYIAILPSDLHLVKICFNFGSTRQFASGGLEQPKSYMVIWRCRGIVYNHENNQGNFFRNFERHLAMRRFDLFCTTLFASSSKCGFPLWFPKSKTAITSVYQFRRIHWQKSKPSRQKLQPFSTRFRDITFRGRKLFPRYLHFFRFDFSYQQLSGTSFIRPPLHDIFLRIR